MASDFTLDRSLFALRFALDGLSERQKVIGQNLANTDTPGYQAKRINFEGALRRLMIGDESLRLVTSNARHQTLADHNPGFLFGLRSGGSQRADGNNVDIDIELTEMSEVGIQYQALSQAASKKLLLLKTIANSQ